MSPADPVIWSGMLFLGFILGVFFTYKVTKEDYHPNGWALTVFTLAWLILGMIIGKTAFSPDCIDNEPLAMPEQSYLLCKVALDECEATMQEANEFKKMTNGESLSIEYHKERR
jgi:hypothetical protein